MKLQLLFVTILIVAITGVLGSEVISLKTSDFESSIKEGIWFVKFFVPWCSHCRNLAPIWIKVAAENGDYIGSRNFNFAEVDCTLNGDLCDKYEVNGYPTLHLFDTGEKVDSFTGVKIFDELSKYVKSKVDHYYPPDHDSEVTNPSGAVVLLTNDNFDKLTKNGIWFVKFFAPWCAHCQRLAPTWEELGHELQNKVNVGKVDCTVDSGLCRRFNVQGYPTLKLVQGSDIIEYKGSRQLSVLKDFAEKAANARVLEISIKDLDRIKKIDDVFFIYLYDDNTPSKILELIKELSRAFFSVKFYSSNDSNIAAQLNIDKLPSLVVLKDDLQKNYPSISTDSRESIKKWIQSEKYPLVPAMDSENYEDILDGDRLVVLGVFRPLEGVQFKTAKKSLESAAKLYSQQIKERSGSEDGKSVIFAWIDGNRWSDYIYGVYGLSKSDLPTVIIADPVSNEYFDTTRSGEKLNLLNQQQLVESIHDAKKGYLTGKSTMGFIERSFRNILSFGGNVLQVMFIHLYISIIVFCLIAGAIYRYCIIPQTRDIKDYERGYGKFE